LRCSNDPIIQVYRDKADITKNLNVAGDITFTGNLNDSNGIFASGGTTYDDANRLNYEFLKEPIGDGEVITNYSDPTSTPSITPTTITGTDYKYMTFTNTNTEPSLEAYNPNGLLDSTGSHDLTAVNPQFDSTNKISGSSAFEDGRNGVIYSFQHH